MSNSDPMFHDALIALRRLANFTILSSIISFALWTLILLFKLHVDFGDLPIWLSVGWTPPGRSHLAQVMLYGCWLTGLQSTAIFYLVMWVRWLKRGNINEHHRGTKLEQGRI